MAKIILYENVFCKRGLPIKFASFQIGTPLLTGYQWGDPVAQYGDGEYSNEYFIGISGDVHGEIKVLADGREKTQHILNEGTYELWV